MILERIWAGIIDQWFIVSISLFMLVAGTWTAYRRYGLKRVLLGKNNDGRELVYHRDDGSIIWHSTIKTWSIILTGGMKLLSIFLLLMLLALAFIYQNDINSTRNNDEALCNEFGTIYPTQQQVDNYYDSQNPKRINISEIKFGDVDEGRARDS